ncbi:TadE/TadG family type IV pilus assembly protein [Stappia sp.]|uniref:TadE/TadG family type IV pilus assembly protein n=1 Tax=Stappia sp. TaxID=1870903 RepID=UPI003A996F1D
MMKKPRLLSRFAADRRGSIVVPLAICTGVCLLVVGAGIDYTRAYNVKVDLQAAVDATALAANYDSDGMSESKIKANAEEYFRAIYKGGDPDKVDLDVSVDKGTVTVKAGSTVHTMLGSVMNKSTIDVSVMSQTVVGKATFDIVMVLDNSGSMSGSKMSTLKKATEDLTETLFKINEDSGVKDRIKIGIVPFTSFVNVGADKADASWMDREGRSPIHWKNFETRNDGTPDPAAFESKHLVNGRPSRFTLFKQMKHTGWLGCVESRPMPYDVDDTPPSISNPATLFVPEFAPDEPSNSNKKWGDSYYNNYLDDDRGACKKTAKKAYKSSGMDRWEYAQKRLCKYKDQPKAFGNTWNNGPNYWCKTQPITDLTENKSTVLRAIRDMKADGHTNIHQGAIWGWRVLSPSEPFTNGREAKGPDEEHVRIMIIMTDGANTYQSQSSFNKTRINAYGYGTEERLGNGVDSSWEIENKMDDRLAQTCVNAKKSGIQVYTVAFQISSLNTIRMMLNCATTPTMAFDAKSNTALLEAFKRISEEITKLRLQM